MKEIKMIRADINKMENIKAIEKVLGKLFEKLNKTDQGKKNTQITKTRSERGDRQYYQLYRNKKNYKQ